MNRITNSIADIEYGITCEHERMDNGELRFRLKSDDGSSYIKTVAGKKAAWQNSHYHKCTKEIYIIQKGWIAFATLLSDGELSLTILAADDILTTEPHIAHNIYMPIHTVIHTIKYGSPSKNDWFESKELDKVTKQLSEKDILKWVKDKGCCYQAVLVSKP